MSVRSSMGDLILRVRTLVNDPAPFPQGSATPQFGDQAIQDFLDRHQAIVRYAQLQPAPDLLTGGVISYVEYVAGDQDWEADAVLRDAAFGVLTPASADLINGVWTLSTSSVPPVFATGKTYDVYAAAADVLEAWAATVVLRFDFSTSDQRFSASQQREGLLELSETYRRRAKPIKVDMSRSDTHRPDLHYLNGADLWGARW